nr:hypothetical protein Iba_chr08bCG6570 [Ipomoea batatas]GMD23577.1 hypothetical protein Iba_chr08bCG6580 [Ipomoea batatas]GMD25020.1 hypothetical protein Iba_chr08cCG6140 [Ipomoea batatas]GMD27842.1 hypothetical protein Iba_chr08eCG1730 [Ipomoea batatas]GMD36540.1 hypothetical protein Iba_scaffold1270024CG0010 [Ipomoea batatas]
MGRRFDLCNQCGHTGILVCMPDCQVTMPPRIITCRMAGSGSNELSHPLQQGQLIRIFQAFTMKRSEVTSYSAQAGYPVDVENLKCSVVDPGAWSLALKVVGLRAHILLLLFLSAKD